MTNPWPDPVAGAPYTSVSQAQLALAAAARLVSDFARGMVPVGPRTTAYDGVMLSDALRLAELVGHVVEAAVVLEREDGTCWQEIDDTFDARHHVATPGASTRHPSAPTHRWAQVQQHWREQVELAALPGVAGVAPGELPETLTRPTADVAHELDEWLLRHHHVDDPDLGPAPVTAGLQEMDPLRELLHLAALRSHLVAAYTDPPGRLIDPIRRRENLLNALLDP